MGEETDYMPVQLVKVILFALVLGVAIFALVMWLSSSHKDDYPYNVAQSFENFNSQIGKVYLTGMTTYTFLTFVEADGYNQGVRYVDNTNGVYLGTECKKNERCLCLSIPDPNNDGLQKLSDCKKVNFNINMVTNIYQTDDKTKLLETVSGCVANHMGSTNKVCDNDKDISFTEALVKISKNPTGVDIVISNGPLTGPLS